MSQTNPWANTDVAPDDEKMRFVEGKADPDRLEAFVANCLVAVGVTSDDAQLTARVLVDADLRGTETHGVALLYTHYIQGVQSGAINPVPRIRTERGSPTTASIDGDRGLGMVVSHRAMSECIAMATESGSGWATAYNSTHSAAGGYYVRMAAEHGMIGFAWSTGGSTIAVPGGKGRLVGNNPFSFASPGGEHGPFVLDMAPSTTMRPKIRMQGWLGRSLPEGWVVDGEGNTITDPGEFFEVEGSILPLGSTAATGAYKGFGLLLMSDILTGVLSGDGGSLLRKKGEHSHAFGALRVDAFPTGAEFVETMDELAAALHHAPQANPGTPIRFPGERANRVYGERCEQGIPFRRFVVDELAEMASELGVPLDRIWR